ncbi:MAG: ferritin family protein [Armatimonadota bacterium]
MIEFNSLQEIIGFAISKEQEAADFYEQLSQDVENKLVAKELLKMKAEEEKHRDWLKSAPIAFISDAEPKRINDLKIAEYIIPAEPAKDMTFQDAVSIAMQRELISMQLYQELAGMVTDSNIERVFKNLAAEEARHKNYFETLWDEYVLTED